MLSVLPRDFSKFNSILCCKAVHGVGGTVFAGVLLHNELKGRGGGRGGEVNKLSAALSRSALEPVNESTSSPYRSSSSSLELVVSLFCLLIYHFLCEIFCSCSSVKEVHISQGFSSHTGVSTLARFPTGRAIIVCVKHETKVTTLTRSGLIFTCLVGRHFETQ